MSSLVRTVLWRRLDEPGAEILELRRHDDGWGLIGVAVLALDGRPVRVRYRVRCDRSWRTRSVDVAETWGNEERELHLVADEASNWSRHGGRTSKLESVTGSVDVDLGVTPATNTLPIRRLALRVGDAAEVNATWVRFPGLEVEPLPQRYTRLNEGSYRYESTDSGFSADLKVDDFGLVTLYSGFWERVASFDP
jgi:uncharacterized protein